MGEMCTSAGLFFKTVGGQYRHALGMYQVILVCAVALEGHDSLYVTNTRPEKSKKKRARRGPA
jgi:hypothetical protein